MSKKIEIIQKLQKGKTLTKEEIEFISHNMNQGVSYGLVWENHPEGVDLELKDGIFKIEELKDKRVKNNPEGRENLLLEGDNLHSLMALKEAGIKVDVIYIDPPYNTLNETGFRYNDKKIDSNDSYRHSKWLSFMYKRLELARDLLEDDGVIFVSIDEYEFGNLKLLMDKVFGENNFIENFIWKKNSIKNNSKTTSTNHEYIFLYSKNIEVIEDKVILRKEKEGYVEVKEIRSSFIKEKKTTVELEEELHRFYKRNNYKGLNQYKYVDDNYNIYRISDVSAPGGSGYNHTLIHPITGEKCKNPKGGYRYNEKKMEELIKNNLIYFGSDEKKVPQFKRYLEDVRYEVPNSIIKNYSEGLNDYRNFGLLPFNNPKPVSLIKYLIGLITKKDIIILDFFAGSGTTGQAVMELNKEDGGNRRFILCTNNENNICEEVTYERNKRVITGEYAKEKVDPLPNNLSYYKVNIENKDSLSYKEKLQLEKESLKNFILWKEDAKILEENSKCIILSNNKEKILVILSEVIDKEIKDVININEFDKIYTYKYLSRDKAFLGINEEILVFI